MLKDPKTHKLNMLRLSDKGKSFFFLLGDSRNKSCVKNAGVNRFAGKIRAKGWVKVNIRVNFFWLG
jgi:hypothetical protein